MRASTSVRNSEKFGDVFTDVMKVNGSRFWHVKQRFISAFTLKNPVSSTLKLANCNIVGIEKVPLTLRYEAHQKQCTGGHI